MRIVVAIKGIEVFFVGGCLTKSWELSGPKLAAFGFSQFVDLKTSVVRIQIERSFIISSMENAREFFSEDNLC